MTFTVQQHTSVNYSDSPNRRRFRDVLEDHIPNILSQTNTSVREVSFVERNKWRGDMFGFLNTKGIDPDLHWITMRINGFLNPNEFPDGKETILVPNIQYINSLLARFETEVII